MKAVVQLKNSVDRVANAVIGGSLTPTDGGRMQRFGDVKRVSHGTDGVSIATENGQVIFDAGKVMVSTVEVER